MVILHYAGISMNASSGVSVIVPQIVNAQAELNQVGFYNFGNENFELSDKVKALCETEETYDYRKFSSPFNHPDLVVFHSPYGIPKGIKVARNLIKDNIPYVIVPHGCFSKSSMEKKKVKKILAVHLIFRNMFHHAAAIQYLSSGEQKSSVIKGKSFVVPNGVLIGEYCQHIKTNDDFTLTYIGRKSIHHKGLDLLINACGLIRQEMKEKHIKLNIYGPEDPAEENTLRRLIEENDIKDVVHIYGPVYGKEKENVIYNTDVFVLTSRFEGLPGAVLEAWANGCPTLLTPGTNLAQEAENNQCGWSTKGTPNSIAQGILNAFAEKDTLPQYAKHAYEYVLKTYGWDAVAKKYGEAYTGLCKKS